MILRKSLNRQKRSRTRATLLKLSLATGIFWVSPQLSNHKAMACLPGLDDTAFVCKTVERVISKENISQEDAPKVLGILLLINLAIVGRFFWKVNRAGVGSNGREKFQRKLLEINTKRGKF